MAEEWRGIVDRIGEDRLREAYANLVRLEDGDN